MAEQNKKSNKSKSKQKNESVKTSDEKKIAAETAKSKTDTKPETTTNSTPKGVQLKVKTLMKVGIAVLVVVLLYVYRGQFIVATVNGQPVTRWELVGELEKQAGKQVLESLISQKLVEQEGRKLNIEISDEEIDAEINSIRDQFALQGGTLEEALAAQGVEITEVRQGIRYQLIMEKILADSVNVTDEEVIQLFEDFDLGEATPERIAEYKETLKQQKIQQETQIWLQQLRQGADVSYLLYKQPEPVANIPLPQQEAAPEADADTEQVQE